MRWRLTFYYLTQRLPSVNKFAAEFYTLSIQTDWSDVTLHTAFYEKLAPCLKNKLTRREHPATLDGLIQLRLRSDQQMSCLQITLCHLLFTATSRPDTLSPTSVNSPFPPMDHFGAREPKQINCTSLTAAERECYYKESLCA